MMRELYTITDHHSEKLKCFQYESEALKFLPKLGSEK